MNEIELTKLFVEYKETALKLAEIEKKIQDEVMALAESQKIAGVKATYYQPSLSYDYQAAAKAANIPDEIIRQFTTITESIRWKEACDFIQADMARFSETKPARVVVKV